MLVHPIQGKEIYEARQKDREAEARMHRLEVSQREANESELVVGLGRILVGLLAVAAAALAIAG
jgi:hypothetical protein